MLTFFNRRELLSTFSMKERGRVIAALEGAGVPYVTRTVDRNAPILGSSSRGRRGTSGQNPALAYEYTVFVHKRDLERARCALAHK